MTTKANFDLVVAFIVSLLSWWVNVLCVMEDTAMNEDRKVGRVDEVKPDLKVDTHRIKNEDLEKEYAYALATKMIKGMLDGGIITQCDSEENLAQ